MAKQARVIMVSLMTITSVLVLTAATLADVPEASVRATDLADARNVQQVLAYAVGALALALAGVVGTFLKVLLGIGNKIVDALNANAAAMSYCRRHSGMDDEK